MLFVGETEKFDFTRQHAGLFKERLACPIDALHLFVVPVHAGIHMSDRSTHLSDVSGLALAGRCNLTYDVTELAHTEHNIVEINAGSAHPLRTFCNGGLTFTDQSLDFTRGGGTALRKIAYFPGDHSKATPLFPRARGFYRSIQRQQIGLEGDAVDLAGNIRNALAGLTDLVHRLCHSRYGCAAALGLRTCLRSDPVCFIGVAGSVQLLLLV